MARLIGLFWILIGLLGYVVYAWTDFSDNTFYDLRGGVEFRSGLMAHLWSAAFLIGGSEIYRRMTGSAAVSPFEQLGRAIRLVGNRPLAWPLVFLTLCSASAYLIAFGFKDLLSRDYYLAEDPGIWPTLAQLSAIIGIVSCVALIASQSQLNRLTAYICGMLLVLLMFGKGSRFAVVGFMMILLSPLLQVTSTRSVLYRAVYIIIIMALTVPLLQSILYFRSRAEYGIIPFAFAIPDAVIALGDADFRALKLLAANLTFSVPVAEVTIQANHPVSFILAELSPLPGGWVGWPEIGPLRRVGFEVPFSGIGEIYGFAAWASALYMMVAGAVLSWVENQYRRLAGDLSIIYMMVYLSMSFLFAVLSLQYNLRDATRLLYYVIFACAFLRVFSEVGIFTSGLGKAR